MSSSVASILDNLPAQHPSCSWVHGANARHASCPRSCPLHLSIARCLSPPTLHAATSTPQLLLTCQTSCIVWLPLSRKMPRPRWPSPCHSPDLPAPCRSPNLPATCLGTQNHMQHCGCPRCASSWPAVLPPWHEGLQCMRAMLMSCAFMRAMLMSCAFRRAMLMSCAFRCWQCRETLALYPRHGACPAVCSPVYLLPSSLCPTPVPHACAPRLCPQSPAPQALNGAVALGVGDRFVQDPLPAPLPAYLLPCAPHSGGPGVLPLMHLLSSDLRCFAALPSSLCCSSQCPTSSPAGP